MIDPARPLGMTSFSSTAQNILRNSRGPANTRRAQKIESRDILASVAQSETPTGDVLRKHGITYGEVMSCRGYYPGKGTLDRPFDESNFKGNFTSDAMEIVNAAILAAASRDDISTREVNEVDLVRKLLESERGSCKLVKRWLEAEEPRANPKIVLPCINALAHGKKPVAVTNANN